MDRWSQLNMQQKNQLFGIYASKGYTDLASIINHYNSFAAGGSLPDHDPNNPYHYHNAKGEKIVITPEDWEANVGKPYFREIEDAVRAEQAAHPAPEYEVNPSFVRDLRSSYAGNMGYGYQNYKNFQHNLPQGYSFTPEGVIIGPDGTAYVQSGYRQTPRFTYSTDNPLQFTIHQGKPIERNLTFYPVNMDRRVKPTLPIDITRNIKKEKENLANSTKLFYTGNNFSEPLHYFFPENTYMNFDKKANNWKGVYLTEEEYNKAVEEAAKNVRKHGKEYNWNDTEDVLKTVLSDYNTGGKWLNANEKYIEEKESLPLDLNELYKSFYESIDRSNYIDKKRSLNAYNVSFKNASNPDIKRDLQLENSLRNSFATGGLMNNDDSDIDGSKEEKKKDNPPAETYNFSMIQPMISVADNTRVVLSPSPIEIAQARAAYEAEQRQKALIEAQRRQPQLKADTRTQIVLQQILK